MAKPVAIRRDYVSFDMIRTPQEAVREFRLNTIKQFINDGHIDEISPIAVIEFDEKAFEGYLLLDGNHRARAAYDLGQPGIWVFVLENAYNRDVSYQYGHHVKDLRIIDTVNKEDIKHKTWNNKMKSKNKYEEYQAA